MLELDFFSPPDVAKGPGLPDIFKSGTPTNGRPGTAPKPAIPLTKMGDPSKPITPGGRSQPHTPARPGLCQNLIQ